MSVRKTIAASATATSESRDAPDGSPGSAFEVCGGFGKAPVFRELREACEHFIKRRHRRLRRPLRRVAARLRAAKQVRAALQIELPCAQVEAGAAAGLEHGQRLVELRDRLLACRRVRRFVGKQRRFSESGGRQGSWPPFSDRKPPSHPLPASLASTTLRKHSAAASGIPCSQFLRPASMAATIADAD